MERLTLTLPALYADHHVASVRAILEKLNGITEIRLSPAAHTAAIVYDPGKQDAAKIEAALAAAGYATGDPDRAIPAAGPAAPRHTAVVAGTLAFGHEAPSWQGRPLWPCPGFDVPAPPKD